MNMTDQALLLFRRLYAADAPPQLRYRAYRRWARRQAQEPGTIEPSSIASRSGFGAARDRRH